MGNLGNLNVQLLNFIQIENRIFWESKCLTLQRNALKKKSLFP